MQKFELKKGEPFSVVKFIRTLSISKPLENYVLILIVLMVFNVHAGGGSAVFNSGRWKFSIFQTLPITAMNKISFKIFFKNLLTTKN